MIKTVFLLLVGFAMTLGQAHAFVDSMSGHLKGTLNSATAGNNPIYRVAGFSLSAVPTVSTPTELGVSTLTNTPATSNTHFSGHHTDFADIQPISNLPTHFLVLGALGIVIALQLIRHRFQA